MTYIDQDLSTLTDEELAAWLHCIARELTARPAKKYDAIATIVTATANLLSM